MKLPLLKSKKSTGRRPSLMPGQAQGYAFRRSRTLTGTTSPKVTSSAERNSLLKTSRLQAHELHGQRRHILRLLAATLMVSVLLGLLIVNFIGTPRLVAVEPGAVSLPAVAYNQTLQTYFKQHPLQRFGLFLDKAAIEGFMLQKHPELVSFTPEVGVRNNEPVFTAAFRKPVLSWDINGQHFFVDESGAAFTFSYYGGQYVAVTDQSGLQPDSGGVVASSRFISFVGQLVGAVNRVEKGNVVSITIPATAREIDVRLAGREYPIKAHLDREPRAQAEDIARAISWFDGRKVTPQYIDVRVANKAFYQ